MTRRVGLVLAVAVLLASVGAASAATAPAPPADSCGPCHVETGDDRLMRPVKAFGDDIHRKKGLGCASCHGGDPREAGMDAMDPAKGYIGAPTRQQIPQLCGRCHSDGQFMKQYNPALRVDQLAEYATSTHGRRLREHGDTKVATCVDCHPAHSIKPPSDPQSSVHPLKVAETCGRCHGDAKHMAGYGIPTDQPGKYGTSVHWKAMSVKGDLSAPTCNDCHGNHGAAPPGTSWVGNVCGQCHTVMADLFSQSVHARAFVALGTPGCATCHENHAIKPASDEMLGLGAAAPCRACHTGNDRGGKAAVEMRTLIDRLRAAHGQAREVLLRAEQSGMEVSQAQFDLNAAADALVKARASIHGFVVDAVRKEVDAGLTVSAKAEARGHRALEELRFRRRGLAVALVIILVVIAGLLVKIRQAERRNPASLPPLSS